MAWPPRLARLCSFCPKDETPPGLVAHRYHAVLPPSLPPAIHRALLSCPRPSLFNLIERILPRGPQTGPLCIVPTCLSSRQSTFNLRAVGWVTQVLTQKREPRIRLLAPPLSRDTRSVTSCPEGREMKAATHPRGRCGGNGGDAEREKGLRKRPGAVPSASISRVTVSKALYSVPFNKQRLWPG